MKPGRDGARSATAIPARDYDAGSDSIVISRRLPPEVRGDHAGSLRAWRESRS
jgi:hypothetical protein